MRRTSAGPWVIVSVIGVAIIVLVLGLGLFKRLDSGQQLLDDAKPAFTADRAAGARGGINIVSEITDFAEPVATAKGTAVPEIPKLIGAVSAKTGLSQAQVVALLAKRYPHTTALLQAVPLSSVTAELPKLVAFLATALKTSPENVQAALAKNFPALAQAVAALPKVTNGFWDVPATASFRSFAGKPVHTVPAVRDYFSDDLVPVVERQQGNLTDLTKRGGIGFIPWLLFGLGIVVALFGLLMALRARSRGLTRGQATFGWSVVTAVGAVVVLLVIGLGLFPRLGGGDELLTDARPAFTAERVAGARAGINIISDVADMTQPIATTSGGAAAEVPKLVAFVSKGTGLSQAQVLAALQQKFPHTAALLTSLPLSATTAELPSLQAFLAKTLGLTPAQLKAALAQDYPGLAQVLGALPAVTNGYNDVPGTEKLTRFNGKPVNTVPEVRDYFSSDVIPVLERQQAHFQDLDDPWPPVNVFPLVLIVVGLGVLIFGIVMLVRTRRGRDGTSEAATGGAAAAA